MNKRALVTLMTAAGLLSSSAAHAGYDFGDWLSVAGFGTIGAYQSDTDNVRYKADNRARAGSEGDIRMDGDTILAVQGTVNPTGQLKGVVQLVSHKKIDGTTYDGSWRPLTEWAYLGWAASPDLHIKLGRVVAPLFMISDARNLGYAQTAVRPFQVMYGLNPITNLDGSTVSWDQHLGNTDLTWTGLYGKTSVATASGAYRINKVFGGALKATHGDWTGRVGYTHFDLDLTLTPTYMASYDFLRSRTSPACDNCTSVIAERTPLSGIKVKMLTAGMLYEHEAYAVQAEFTTRLGNSLAVPDTKGWYVQTSRRWDAWTPYLRYGEMTIADHPGLTGTAPYVATSNEKVLFGNATRKEWGLGVRWDFAPKVALKLDYTMLTSTFPNSTAGVISPPTAGGSLNEFDKDKGQVNVITLNLDFVF
ncbi:MAG: hypothetical protein HY836_06090 [Aquabacterium sp.]|uniref:hypothetical protein n=1 Tax=Aquabacterium sp. TaxID=1872578 RepID=UPI0025C1E13C|nr:hypothetical protein [Aquabacterium sp.]MBI5925151.1 hypothetical protein [Aquabacterium sp.]